MRRRSASVLDAAPTVYKGFRLLEHDEWFYAFPENFGPVDWRQWRQLLQHPAVLAAPSRGNLELLIDDFDASRLHVELLGTFEGYRLHRFQERIYAVPETLGSVDLVDPVQRNHRDILSGDSPDEVQNRIRATRSASPVEFAGWLPVFRRFGNCGLHPQFGHTENPPKGFRFVRSGWIPPDPVVPVPCRRGWIRSLRVLMRLVVIGLYAGLLSVWMFARNLVRYGPRRFGAALGAAIRLYVRLRRRGGRLLPVLRFIHTRHFESQLMLPDDPGLVFYTSVPFTYGQHPWVIEIEDSTTLFFPFLHNGQTAHVQPRELPCWPLVRELLEAPSCRAIVTHMRSTAESLPVLFDSPTIAAKTFHLPMGVQVPSRPVDQEDDDIVHLLFTNSWHQQTVGFRVRGGYEVLEAFSILQRRYKNLRLTMRTVMPPLIDRHARMLEQGWVRVIGRFLPSAEMAELQRQSHIYLLPAARIHIVSLLQAMAYGQAVVGTDGWGFAEYLEDNRNGLVVRGRSHLTWMDEKTGLLREDYSQLYKPDPVVVAGLVESISRLVEDRALRRRLATTARADVEQRFNLKRWNEGLGAIFEQAQTRRD